MMFNQQIHLRGLEGLKTSLQYSFLLCSSKTLFFGKNIFVCICNVYEHVFVHMFKKATMADVLHNLECRFVLTISELT